MKRFLTISIMALLTACGASQYVSQRMLEGDGEISYVLANYYPQLFEYYEEGVLGVTSIKEVVLPDGTMDYKVKYKFIRYYYETHREKVEVLRTYYPELYQMYVNGVINVYSVYKYVEQSTGIIRHHVSYDRYYDYYYYPRSRYHQRYRVRPTPPPPATRPPRHPQTYGTPPPRRPEAGHNNPPKVQPGNPEGHNNNPPRTQPSTPPRRSGSGMSNNSPRPSGSGIHSNPSRPSGGHSGNTPRPGGNNSRRR